MKKTTRKTGAPVTRLGWFLHYARKANRSMQNTQAAHLACWYWFLLIEFEPAEGDWA